MNVQTRRVISREVSKVQPFKGLQSSPVEIREPIMMFAISSAFQKCSPYGRVAKRKLFLRKAMLEKLRAFGKRFYGLMILKRRQRYKVWHNNILLFGLLFAAIIHQVKWMEPNISKFLRKPFTVSHTSAIRHQQQASEPRQKNTRIGLGKKVCAL